MTCKYAPLITFAVIAVAGCGSIGATDAAAGPSASAVCTTRACIVTDVQKSLVGIVAKDESVMTKAVCKPSTVKHNPGDTWTVTCTVTYSDGSEWRGYANLLPTQGKVTFQPRTVVKS